jgi:hypothetical protein
MSVVMREHLLLNSNQTKTLRVGKPFKYLLDEEQNGPDGRPN